MILLRRLNGSEIGVNADLIERVESTPDTILTLVDGTKYVVSEPAEEVVARIVEFRARILAAAESFVDPSDAHHHPVPLRLVVENAPGDAPEQADGSSTLVATEEV
jgi:flagellar protein FlbD